MKVEVADLASPSLISLTVFVDVKHHERKRRLSESSVPQAFVSFSSYDLYDVSNTWKGRPVATARLAWDVVQQLQHAPRILQLLVHV